MIKVSSEQGQGQIGRMRLLRCVPSARLTSVNVIATVHRKPLVACGLFGACDYFGELMARLLECVSACGEDLIEEVSEFVALQPVKADDVGEAADSLQRISEEFL